MDIWIVLFIEGMVLFTFLLMNALTDAGFCYTVTPEFPFESFIYPDIALCPTCGTPTVENQCQKVPKIWVFIVKSVMNGLCVDIYDSISLTGDSCIRM